MPKHTLPAAGRGLPDNPRGAIEATVARLIDLLDALDGDPDLEPSLGAQPGPLVDAEFDDSEMETEDEREASLGWTGHIDQTHIYQGGGCASFVALGAAQDLTDRELDEADLEPWLGATAAVNQTRWANGNADMELDRSDFEPSLGSGGGYRQEDQSQECWGAYDRFAPLDGEAEEGDAEPEADEDSLGAPAGDGNQARWAQGAAGDREATGTVDDIETHPDFSKDRSALYAVERQVRALARRIEGRRPGGDRGNLREVDLFVDPHGDLFRVRRVGA